MLERTDAITKEVLEPITFVLAYTSIIPIKTISRNVILVLGVLRDKWVPVLEVLRDKWVPVLGVLRDKWVPV